MYYILIFADELISKRCVGATKQHEFLFTLRCYGQNLDQS